MPSTNVSRYAPHRATLKERITFHVTPDPETGCWIWNASLDKGGYGRMLYPGKRTGSAHRHAYEAFVGPVPDDICVLHKCDNPPCCNPEHLFLGTHDDNMKDKARKGRSAKKLSADQVIEIRKDQRLISVIAEEYGVNESVVSAVRTRRSWKWVH